MAVQITTGSVATATLSTTFNPRDLSQVYAVDLNNDGNDDLVVLSASYPYKGDPVAQPSFVAFGTGNGGFREATQSEFAFASLATVHPREVVFADFNGDGYKDVFVASHGYDATPFPGEQNRLFLSRSDGTWYDATSTSLPQLSDFSHSAAAGDVDGDGDLDIFVGNTPQPNPNLPYILVNDGNGNFTKNDALLPTGVGGALNPNVRRLTSSALADLDGDGRVDLVLGAAFSTDAKPVTDKILWNTGSGFASAPSTDLPFPASSGKTQLTYDIQATDLNGDGRPDLVIAYQRDVALGGWELQVLINQGDRSFVDATTQYLPDAAMRTNGAPSSASPESQYWIQFLDMADINDDGRLDFTLDARGITGAPATLPEAFVRQADGSFATATVADIGGANNQWMFGYTTQFVRWQGGSGFAHVNAYDGKLTVDVLPARFAATQGIVDQAVDGAATPDQLRGAAGNDTLRGQDGNDVLHGGGGNDAIDGGSGRDLALYDANRANYTIMRTSSGYTVTDKTGSEGKDSLSSVEKLRFADSTLTIEYDEVVQSLYVAYFGRAADTGGIANFQNYLVSLGAPHDLQGLSALYGANATIKALIDSFGNSQESKDLYGTGTTRDFVTAIYTNVLNRAPDAGGLTFWADAIDKAGLSKGNAALSIMSGALSNTTAQGLVDGALVRNKLAAAANFTFAVDTSAEVAAYSGNAAAASVRQMLSAVTGTTDVEAFQATVTSTLSALVAKAGQGATEAAAAPVLPVELIGIAAADAGGWH